MLTRYYLARYTILLGEITEEDGQRMMESYKQMIDSGTLNEEIKYFMLVSNKFDSYIRTFENLGRLSQNEMELNDIIHSMYYHFLEYNSRKPKTYGSTYSVLTVTDVQDKQKADERKTELRKINQKDTESLVEDYEDLYSAYKRLIKLQN